MLATRSYRWITFILQRTRLGDCVSKMPTKFIINWSKLEPDDHSWSFIHESFFTVLGSSQNVRSCVLSVALMFCLRSTVLLKNISNTLQIIEAINRRIWRPYCSEKFNLSKWWYQLFLASHDAWIWVRISSGTSRFCFRKLLPTFVLHVNSVKQNESVVHFSSCLQLPASHRWRWMSLTGFKEKNRALHHRNLVKEFVKIIFYIIDDGSDIIQ